MNKRTFLIFIHTGTGEIVRVEDVTDFRPEKVTMPDHIIIEATETNRWFVEYEGNEDEGK